MIKKLCALLVLPITVVQPSIASSNFDLTKFANPERYFSIQYDGFSMFYDCYEKSPVIVEAIIGNDTGNVKRSDDFKLDPNVPKECQQKSTKSYRKYRNVAYDRGHLISHNQLDYSDSAASASFYFTNIHPQASTFNRSGWKYTEDLTECFRDDYEQVKVLVGLKFEDSSNDYQIKSHGIKTADKWWKIIQTGDSYVAWVFPNSNSVRKSSANRYLVSSQVIEQMIGLPLNIKSRQLTERELPDVSKCDLS